MAQGDAFSFADNIGETSQSTIISPSNGEVVKIDSISVKGDGGRSSDAKVEVNTYDNVNDERVGRVVGNTGPFSNYSGHTETSITIVDGGDVSLEWNTSAGDGNGFSVTITGIVLK